MHLALRRALPYVLVFEEPSSEGIRLHRQENGELAGTIIGINSTEDHITYPKICVVSLHSFGYVQVFCVTASAPYRPLPHKLIRCYEDGTRDDPVVGVISTRVLAHFPVVEFRNVKIEYVPRQNIRQTLITRRTSPNDPFARSAELQDWEIEQMELNSTRLCFQVYIKTVSTGKFQPIMPVVSAPINLITPTDEKID